MKHGTISGNICQTFFFSTMGWRQPCLLASLLHLRMTLGWHKIVQLKSIVIFMIALNCMINFTTELYLNISYGVCKASYSKIIHKQKLWTIIENTSAAERGHVAKTAAIWFCKSFLTYCFYILLTSSCLKHLSLHDENFDDWPFDNCFKS